MFSFLIASLLLAVGTITYIFSRLLKHQKYWPSRGIPGPPSSLWFGHIREIGKSEPGWAEVIAGYTKQYGPIFGLQEGRRNILVVADLKLAHEVLVTQYHNFEMRQGFPADRVNPNDNPDAHMFGVWGPRWKRLRALGSPPFSNNNMRKVLPKVEDSVLQLMTFLDHQTDGMRPVELHRNFQEVTLDVIERIALGQERSKIFQNDHYLMLRNLFDQDHVSPIYMIPLLLPEFCQDWIASSLDFIGKLVTIPFLKIFDGVKEVVRKRKEERDREAEEEGGELSPSTDFIDLFLASVVDEIDVNDPHLYRKLDAREVAGQCLILLFAGFDTTSIALSVTSYYLATHPDVQARARQEIEEFCTTDSVDFEQLAQLKYNEAIMKEVLRLHPIAAQAVARTCTVPTQLGDVTVEPGVIVYIDSQTILTSPDVWGETAHEFNPDRWLTDSPYTTPSTAQAANLAFGAGPRVCLGQRFAYLEQKLVMAHLLRRFEILPTPGMKLELRGSLITYPKAVNVILKKLQS